MTGLPDFLFDADSRDLIAGVLDLAADPALDGYDEQTARDHKMIRRAARQLRALSPKEAK